MQLAEGIVRQAGGLPLALEVLGSYLFGRSMEEWRSSLAKLQQIPRDEIQKKLLISYYALGDGNLQNVFLDIACYFIGKDKDMTISILNSCGFNTENDIKILMERCLLSVNDKKLRMHDLLREMGREIARNNRLWSCEDICNVLSKSKVIIYKLGVKVVYKNGMVWYTNSGLKYVTVISSKLYECNLKHMHDLLLF